ncbi:hypothetical protein OEZ86_002891 [Tetradesmus obliquus]|nr:hypothetical protein OEZ86_002891 [Tetradesmus obliquus]
MDTSTAPEGSPVDVSDDAHRHLALSSSDAFTTVWPEAVITDDEDDEGRAHRKRGPKRGRADGQPKRQREVPDTVLEEEVAHAVGLDVYGMSEHEAGLLADDLDEEVYCQVRNHILARWRADVSAFLSEEEAAAKILPKHRHLVSAAWRFLDLHGHINWGVAPAVMARPSSQRQETVVVIGAGLAGLSAARQLANHGYKVLVVEGSSRPGGRVFTQRMQSADGSIAAAADLGGSIITGIDGNPLAVIARQLDIPLHDINSSDVPLYLRDGSQLDAGLDLQVEAWFNQLLDRSAALRDSLGRGGDAISLQSSLDGLWSRREARVRRHEQQQHGLPQQQQQQQQQQQVADDAEQLRWHLANIEFANATRLRRLSMRHWDLDDEYEHGGSHVFLPGGNLRLLEGLAQGLPIFYNSTARLLQYSAAGVQVHTDAGVFTADAALVTIPLGVLKRPDAMVFQPQLPPRKRAAIRRLGFGCLNKVMLLFPHCFWGDKDMFGHVSSEPRQRGRYYLFYTYDSISGGAVLAALVAGDAAVEFEAKPEAVAVGEVMALLRGIFGPQGVVVPEPLQAVCTRWASDPMCYGSYSSVAVGSSGAADYDALAQPLGDRVFFAGEATTSRYPATMHGAFATGLREAAAIMAAFAAQRGEELRPALMTGKEMREAADPGSVAAGQQLVQLASLLQQVFDSSAVDSQGLPAGPDEEFGVFAAAYGPPGTEFEDQALLAINLAALRSAAKHAPVVIYTSISRTQLELLRDVPGGDERRLGMLAGELGVKLVGRPLQGDSLRLLEAIVQHRGLAGSGDDGDGEDGTGSSDEE